MTHHPKNTYHPPLPITTEHHQPHTTTYHPPITVLKFHLESMHLKRKECEFLVTMDMEQEQEARTTRAIHRPPPIPTRWGQFVANEPRCQGPIFICLCYIKCCACVIQLVYIDKVRIEIMTNDDNLESNLLQLLVY